MSAVADDRTAAPELRDHVCALGRRLHGPVRLRAEMLAEVHDGLTDAAEAHRAAGLDPAESVRAAIAEFGTVDEVAAELQAELTATQGRSTARAVVGAFVALPALWDVAWRATGGGRGMASDLEATSLLNFAQDATSLLAVLAGALLLVVLRRGSPGQRTTRAIAVVGLLGGGLCGSLAVAQNVVDPAATAAWVRSAPLLLVAYAASLAGLVTVLTSSARSLRLLGRLPGR